MISASRFWQFYASFASGFGCLVLAILSVWSSYTSPLYSSNSTTPLTAPITKLENSLLGSVPALGAMVGTAIAAYILDKFGRRNGGILLSLPFVISWAVIGISSSINVILAARFLGGVSGGGAFVFGPIVVSEVSEDSIRGFLASVSIFQYCMGTLVSYVMGLYLSYRMVIWINIAFSICCIVLLMFMEETPVYLVRKRKYKPLQIGSSVTVSLCLVGLGYTLQFDVAPSEVTVVLIMLFSFFYMVGVGSVPYVLLAEVFAPEVLNCASMLVVEWMWLLNFVIIAVFPYVTDLVGIFGAFYGFSIVSCANAIISYYILPETAGLSNKEIQVAFLGRENKRRK